MNHTDIVNALSIIRPEAEFVLRGEEIEWLDQTQKPTTQEIEEGLKMYSTAKAEAESQAQAKREAVLAKLEALGLDEDDLKALGL